jgi:hypothetical protein
MLQTVSKKPVLRSYQNTPGPQFLITKSQ